MITSFWILLEPAIEEFALWEMISIKREMALYPRMQVQHPFPRSDELSKMRADPRTSTSASSGTLVIFEFISLGLIIAIGSAGNCVVVYAFSRYFHLRRSPYALMVGFVTLDLVRLCLCFPIVFVTIVHPLQSKYATEFCQWMAFSNVFCLVGNKLSILGMAIDRYVDNKHRSYYRRKWRGPVGIAMLLTVWGLTFLLTFPAISGVRPRKSRIEAECTFPSYNSSNIFGWLVSLAVSFTITNFLYIRLFVFLRSRRKMRPVLYEPAVSENWGFPGVPVSNRWPALSPISVVGPPSDSAMWRSKQQRENENLTKLCLTIHIIFSLLWLPYVIIYFWWAFQKSNVPVWAEKCASWLTYIQVTITPFTFLSHSRFSRRCHTNRWLFSNFLANMNFYLLSSMYTDTCVLHVTSSPS